jgi:hypothetical protein
MIITTEDVDRTGEVIKIDGWNIENYMANPVVLFGHDYRSLPVGITTELTVKGKKMVAKGYFAPEDANPVAGQVAKLYELGLLKTASVGFIPQYDPKDSSVIIGAELLEWSFTPVPANPHALDVMKGLDVEAFSAKGLISKEKSAEEMIKEIEVKHAERIDELEKELAEVKAGRVLSKNTLKLITEIADKLDSIVSLSAETSQALKDLAASAASEQAPAKNFDSQALDDAKLLEQRNLLKSIATSVQDALRQVNEESKKRKGGENNQ